MTPKGKKKKDPYTLRRDVRRRANFLKKKMEVSNGDDSSQNENVSEVGTIKEVVEKEVFKCEQCENIFKSENGLKIYVGKAHKKVNSIPSTPDRLRQQLMGSVSLSAPPPLGHQQGGEQPQYNCRGGEGGYNTTSATSTFTSSTSQVPCLPPMQQERVQVESGEGEGKRISHQTMQKL